MSRKLMMIAGAGPGMGRAVACLAANHGYDVALIARRPEILKETAALVRAEGAAALCLPADVTIAASVAGAVAATLAQFGRIDALVHSILPPHLFKRILDLGTDDLEDWRKSAEISIYGALLVAHAVAKPMAAAGKGSMVFATATSGLQSYPAVSAHAVGKAGIHSLMQSLASELGPAGIRANAMAVGVIDGATSRQPKPEMPPQMAEDLRRAVDPSAGALRRNITEDEAAQAIMFLASDAASGITGQILAVDGGRLFH